MTEISQSCNIQSFCYNKLETKELCPVSAEMLAGMIKQVNQDIQKTYSIQSNPILELPKSKDFSARQSYFLGKINKLQKEFKLKDSDPIFEYHIQWWENFIIKRIIWMYAC